MSKLTRGGVCYDLEKSPYRYTVSYKENTLEFVFSSQYYKDKFINRLEEHRNEVSVSLSKRWGFMISNDLISDVKLYEKIEKRGFLIIKEGEPITWLENLKLDGENLMKRN